MGKKKVHKDKETYRISFIRTPDGELRKFFVDDSTDREELLQNFVWNNWSRYIESNWLNYRRNDRTCPEEKIKWLLNGCGDLWLMGHTNDSGILSRYKEMQIGDNEITMSDLQAETDGHAGNDCELNDDAEEAAEEEGRQRAPKSKFLRMNELMQHGRLSSVRVDTDNVFSYGGKRYRISLNVEQYLPKQTELGYLYDADTVYCFIPNSMETVEFFGQDLLPLDGMVEELS